MLVFKVLCHPEAAGSHRSGIAAIGQNVQCRPRTVQRRFCAYPFIPPTFFDRHAPPQEPSRTVAAASRCTAGRMQCGADEPVRRRGAPATQPDHPVHRADAADRGASDRAHADLRLAVPKIQHPGRLPARLGSLDPARTAHLGRAIADHHRAGRADLDQHAHARPVPSAAAHRCRTGRDSRHRSAGDRCGRARLEVALHLPRARHRARERGGGPGRPADPVPDHLVGGHEFVLHPRAGRADLCHAGHGNEAERRHQQARRVRRLFSQLQRCRLLGHALQIPRPGQRRLRPLGPENPGRRRQADP